MVWLGDNIYLWEVDWYIMIGIFYWYIYICSLFELQFLLVFMYYYVIWDDYDFGLNDFDCSFIYKDKILEAFKLFWGNFFYGLLDMDGGIIFYFQYYDMDFFLLDDCYF